MGEYNPAAAAESSFANPQLLEKIDKLFACNVGEHVALPQLVVVGDQSSGKRYTSSFKYCFTQHKTNSAIARYLKD